MESDNQCGEILDNVYLQIYELPVDVELLDNDFQQANFMAIAQVMAQPAHTSLWCVMHDCAFTHAYSIVMVEYIINLFFNISFFEI